MVQMIAVIVLRHKDGKARKKNHRIYLTLENKLVRQSKQSGIHKVQHKDQTFMSYLVQGAIKYIRFELCTVISSCDNFTV